MPLIEFLIDNGNRFDLLHARLFSRCFFTGRHYASRLRIFSPPTLLPSTLSSTFLSLSLFIFLFFFLPFVLAMRSSAHTHTHRYIERVRSFARSTFSFYLREYVASSLIEFIHPSKWKSDQRSFSSTILFSSDHFAELFLPPLFSLFPLLFIHLPRRVNRPPLSLQ